MIATASLWTLTIPVLVICLAAVLFTAYNLHWRRQDRKSSLFDRTKTPWELEQERRRLQRQRAERRHAVSEARRRGAEQYRRGVVR